MRRSTKRKIFAITILIIICYLLISTIINVVTGISYRRTYEYKLIEHGYEKDTVAYFENYFDEKYLDWLLDNEKNDHIEPLTKEKYFVLTDMQKYLSYIDQTNSDDYTNVVALVNTGAYQGFYENITETNTDIPNQQILVNKFHQLPANFKPDEIVEISNFYAYAERTMDGAIYEIFKEMWNAAKDADATLIVISGYRSYESQDKLYESYLSSDGRLNADRYSARPGHSEHQLGLALDIVTHGYGLVEEFDETNEFAWLIANAHKYGFILRYPKDKEHITGYVYEPWHFRYVGTEIANYIHQNNITFDEYYAYYLAK